MDLYGRPSELEGARRAVELALRKYDIAISCVAVVQNNELVLRGSVDESSDAEKAYVVAYAAAQSVPLKNQLIVTSRGSHDIVYEAGLESFPASDPPCWMSR